MCCLECLAVETIADYGLVSDLEHVYLHFVNALRKHFLLDFVLNRADFCGEFLRHCFVTIAGLPLVNRPSMTLNNISFIYEVLRSVDKSSSTKRSYKFKRV